MPAFWNPENREIWYCTNLEKNLPITEDLMRIFLKTESIGKEILTKFPDKEKIRYALIYGSFAKGTESSSSDIDLLILGK